MGVRISAVKASAKSVKKNNRGLVSGRRGPMALLAFAVAAAGGSLSRGDSLQYVGPSNGAWSFSNNWSVQAPGSGSHVPGPLDQVDIHVVSQQFPVQSQPIFVTLDTNATIQTLTLGQQSLPFDPNNPNNNQIVPATFLQTGGFDLTAVQETIEIGGSHVQTTGNNTYSDSLNLAGGNYYLNFNPQNSAFGGSGSIQVNGNLTISDPIIGFQALGAQATFQQATGNVSVGGNEVLGIPSFSPSSVHGQSAYLLQGGINTVGGDLTVGSVVSGLFSLSAGATLTVAGTEYVSDNAQQVLGIPGGEFDQTAGTNNANGNLVVGNQQVASGVYKLSGGNLLVAGTNSATGDNGEYIGYRGAGSFIQTGGNHTIGSPISFVAGADTNPSLIIGNLAGSIGNYTMNSSAGLSTLNVWGNEIVGNIGNGTFTETSSQNNVANNLYIGHSGNSVGAYAMTDSLATLIVGGDEFVAYASAGAADQAGGTFTQTDGFHIVGGNLYTGYHGIGFFELDGGTLRTGGGATQTSDASGEYIGYSTRGTFSQSNGTHVDFGDLFIAYGVNSTGTYTMTDGTLTLPGGVLGTGQNAEFIGYGGKGSFDQSGGTNTISSNTTFDANTNGAFPALIVGYAGLGTYVLNNAAENTALTVWGNEFVGFGLVGGKGSGGIFGQEGGTNEVANNLYVGYLGVSDGNTGAVGVFTLAAGTLRVGLDSGAGFEYIGWHGQGTFTQTGGIDHVGGSLVIGNTAESFGIFSLDQVGKISEVIVGRDEYIAYQAVGLPTLAGATFTQSAGEHEVFGNLYIGWEGSGDPSAPASASANGSYSMTGGQLEAGQGFSFTTDLPGIYIAYYGKGDFNQSGGHVNDDGDLYLGFGTGGVGTYELTAGTLVTVGNEYIAYSGDAFMNQSGGTNTIGNQTLFEAHPSGTNTLAVGIAPGSFGIYELSGNGTLTVWGDEIVGVNAFSATQPNGTFGQLGGLHTIANSLVIGLNGTDTQPQAGFGRFVLSDGTLVVGNDGGQGDEIVGFRGNGIFAQTGGNHVISNDLFIAYDPTSHGNFTLGGSTAELTVFGNEYLGRKGNGTFSESDGVHSIGNNLYIGWFGPQSPNASNSPVANGAFTLSGGDLFTAFGTNNSDAPGEYIGYFGNGNFTQSGGLHKDNGDLYLGFNAGGNGNYSQSGGNLIILGSTTGNNGEYIGFNGVGSFLQTGGIHVIGSATTFGLASNPTLVIGYGTNSFGTYTMNNGVTPAELFVYGDEIVGYGANGNGPTSGGVFIQYNGNHVVADSLFVGLNGIDDQGSVATGEFDLVGGSLTIGLPLGNGNLNIGNNGVGKFFQAGGTAQVNGFFYLGYGQDGLGNAQLLDSGSLTVQQDEFIGYQATGNATQSGGTFNQSGGSHVVVGSLIIGAFGGGGSPTATGFYGLSGGTLEAGQIGVTASPGEIVGYGGNGTFTQDGGSNTADTDLYVGFAIGANGQYSIDALNAPATLTVNGNIYVGWGGGASAIPTFAALATPNIVQQPDSDSANGTFTLSNGTVLAGGGNSATLDRSGEYIGYSGNGTFLQTGGTNTDQGNLFVAFNASSIGLYMMSGDASILTVGADEFISYNAHGTDTTPGGEFDQSGGSHFIGGNLDVGYRAKGIFNLSGGSLTVQGNQNLALSATPGEFIGSTGNGTFIQTGGSHTIGSPLLLSESVPVSLYVGDQNGSLGNFSLDNSAAASSLTVYGDETIGNSGVGIFTQGGATNSINGNLYVGYGASLFFPGGPIKTGPGNPFSAQPSGNYTLSGGTLTILGNTLAPLGQSQGEYIGVFGHGTFTQTGGENNIGSDSAFAARFLNDLYVGFDADSQGNYTLSNGTLAVHGIEWIGVQASSFLAQAGATFNQSGGNHTIQASLIIAFDGPDNALATNSQPLADTPSTGSFNLSGGSLTILGQGDDPGAEVVGGYGYATFTQTGGNHTIGSASDFAAGRSINLYIGIESASIGQFSLSDDDGPATLTVYGNESVGYLANGTGSAGFELFFLAGGLFNQTGGSHTVMGNLTIGELAGAVGEFDISAGTLVVHGATNVGAAGTGSLNINGGIVQTLGGLSISPSSSVSLTDGTLETTTLNTGGDPTLLSWTGGTLQFDSDFSFDAGQPLGDSLQLDAGMNLFAGPNATITNNGIITLNGGTIGGPGQFHNTGSLNGFGSLNTGGFTNDGNVTITGGTSTINGNVTNNGSLEVTAATTTITGTFVNNGTFISDPSTTHFDNGITVATAGTMAGSAGDLWTVAGDFLNNSTQATTWDSTQVHIEFAASLENTALSHTLAWSGADEGATLAGFTNNFAIGTLEIDPGNMLLLQDSLSSGHAAIYVDALLLDGAPTSNFTDLSAFILADISQLNSRDPLDIYYDASNPANIYLGDQTYALSGGGELIPVGSAVPEPASLAVLGIGAICLLRRRQRP